MTRVIVIRHGNSVNNALRRNTGHADVPLSPQGRKEAECLADYLVANEHIDAIYASDLIRAVDTVKPTADRLGLSVITERDLRETDVGAWTNMVYEDALALYPEIREKRRSDPTCPCPEGESNAAVFARVSAVLARLLDKHRSGTIVIATHAFPVRVIEAIATGHTVFDMEKRIVIPNASIRIYTAENGVLAPAGEPIVSHLQSLAVGES